ncbi:MAG: energy transducer TonB [Phenylobacterium sp.]
MSRAAARRIEVSPWALGSLGLHLSVAAVFMISWGARDLKVGSVTPVTLVASVPDADTRPAVEGPETQEAAAETVAAEAPPREPAPAPPAPIPPPKTAQTPPPKAAATPAAKAAPRPETRLDLDALAASLTAPARNAPRQAAAAKTGPTRAEAAPVARQAPGVGLASGQAATGLTDELQRRWNPTCEVEGGRDVLVRVTFTLGATGQVLGDVASQIQGVRNPVSVAGAERAVRAVYAAQPFRGLPREFYGARIAVNFNAKEACAR